MIDPVVQHGDHTHRLAPAHEDPAWGWATRYTQTLCHHIVDDAMPLLPVGADVTCPRCQRVQRIKES